MGEVLVWDVGTGAKVAEAKRDAADSGAGSILSRGGIPDQPDEGGLCAGGVSLLSVAGRYEVPLGRLLEFNDMKEEDVLVKGQLIFLQRKRRTGSIEFHVVREGKGYTISRRRRGSGCRICWK
jgi:hypothetical protein